MKHPPEIPVDWLLRIFTKTIYCNSWYLFVDLNLRPSKYNA